MPNFILTRSSIILCPHGGMVTHVPMGFAGELINGELPLMLTDTYFIAGCPNLLNGTMSACFRVMWLTGSVTKLINGVPVLTNISIGICQSISNIPQGPPIIAAFQTVVTD